MSEAMFCYQCQETAANRGCNRTGMCGKNPETARMQDLLVHATKALACVAVRLRKDKQEVPAEVDARIRENLRATATNVNFDAAAIEALADETIAIKKDLLSKMEQEQRDKLPKTAAFEPKKEEYAEVAPTVGVLATEDEDVRSLRELVIGGLKGMADMTAQAADHSADTTEIDDFLQRALVDTQNEAMTGGNLLALVMETGRFGLKCAEMLARARRAKYGAPKAADVSLAARKKPAILVSGSDLRVLEETLKQTADTGLDVYTHGDLLSAHGYPDLQGCAHLAGHIAGSWWEQKEQFDHFAGPIVVAGDGLIPPRESYAGRLFTAGAARYPGVTHLEKRDDGTLDLTAVIGMAKESPAPEWDATGTIMTGYDETQFFALADSIAGALKEEKISKFVVLAGCDGRARTREYYADFAKRLPETAIVLAAGSIKNRFNRQDFGEINGIPRLLDFGSAEESWALIQAAHKLGEAVGGGVIRIPLVYNIAWYDQKSLLFLFSLFYMDIRNIYVGPTLPAILTPSVHDILVKYFGISGISTVETDLQKLFGTTEQLIRGDMIVAEIVNTYPQLVPVLLGEGLHCISCGVSEMETLDEACQVHGLNPADIIELLNDSLAHGV